MEVGQTEEELTAYDRDVCFGKYSWFELLLSVVVEVLVVGGVVPDLDKILLLGIPSQSIASVHGGRTFCTV